ncbi:hypothetical protein CEXT_693731 [Caerostris extrusa]|uniref:Uncharacterized protein n=1 Tax=Caerostris extrusa TaxID=172846 RepID=A0AAV4XZA3_CAEEX|nr:hypothetical protein CEXT_693731 [Caerostris extrusa]
MRHSEKEKKEKKFEGWIKSSAQEEKGKGLLPTPSSLFNLGGFRRLGEVEFAKLKQKSSSKRLILLGFLKKVINLILRQYELLEDSPMITAVHYSLSLLFLEVEIFFFKFWPLHKNLHTTTQQNKVL